MDKSGSFDRKKPFRNTIRSIVAENLKGRFREKGVDGFYEYAREYLERLNIQPDFVKKNDVRFPSWRKRLKSARGVMISNHPSILDAALLSQALARDDFKLVATREMYERVKGSELARILIPASRKDSIHETKGTMRSISDHIGAGGLVWIFPTGGAQIDRSDPPKPVHFASGFDFVLKQLAPEDMVYAFHIDTEDLKPVASVPNINASFLSGEYLPSQLNIAHMREKRLIKIDEVCTDARDWQTVSEATDRKERNEVFTKHYLKLFDIPGTEMNIVNRD